MKNLLLSLFSLLSTASLSHSAVQVGDKPDLSFQAADGTPISLANLRGKIVIVDFWATWCGPCMGEAAHMVQLKDQYEPKGVRILGISLDSSKNEMLKIAREKGFTWPQYFDGKVWQNKISTEWGVHGIPATFVIGPDGDVLWTGHPAGIDAPLAKILKEHPPRLLDPKALADATASLDKAEQLIVSKDFAAAIKSFAKIPLDAKSEPGMGTRIDTALKQLEDYATNSLSDAEKLIDEKQFGPAVVKLRDISRLTGLPAAADATKRMNVILAMPQAKAQIDAAEKAEREKDRLAHAADALTNAQKLQAAKKDDQAYLQFKSIVSTFPNTPAATSAAEQVATYEKDPAFVKRVTGAANDSKAKALLNMADNYKTNGKTDLAKQKYQLIIEQFPHTPYSETAKKELKDLN